MKLCNLAQTFYAIRRTWWIDCPEASRPPCFLGMGLDPVKMGFDPILNSADWMAAREQLYAVERGWA